PAAQSSRRNTQARAHGRAATKFPNLNLIAEFAKSRKTRGLKTKTPRRIVEAHFSTWESVSHHKVLSRAIFNFFADFLTSLCFQEHSRGTPVHPPRQRRALCPITVIMS